MTVKAVNINGHYYDVEILRQCWTELEGKRLLAQAKLETPSVIDRVMFDILRDAYPHNRAFPKG